MTFMRARRLASAFVALWIVAVLGGLAAVPTCDQPQDREGAGLDDPAIVAAAGRPSHRV